MMQMIPGGGRVYVHVPGAFSDEKWIENYKKGRSFATNGPILKFSVDDKGPGEELRIPAADRRTTVMLSAQASSIVPMEKLEIIVNGSVVASIKPEQKQTALQVHYEMKVDHSFWAAALALGPAHRLVVNDAQVFVHSSPVYCYFGKSPIVSETDALFWLEWIERLITSIEEHGLFASAEKRDRVTELFRKAQEVYRRMCSSSKKQATVN